MRCAKCNIDTFVVYKRFGYVKGTKMKQYRALCQDCLKILKDEKKI